VAYLRAQTNTNMADAIERGDHLDEATTRVEPEPDEHGGHWEDGGKVYVEGPPTGQKIIIGTVLSGDMESCSDNPRYDGLGWVSVYAPSEQIAGLRIGSPATVIVHAKKEAG